MGAKLWPLSFHGPTFTPEDLTGPCPCSKTFHGSLLPSLGQAPKPSSLFLLLRSILHKLHTF